MMDKYMAEMLAYIQRFFFTAPHIPWDSKQGNDKQAESIS